MIRLLFAILLLIIEGCSQNQAVVIKQEEKRKPDNKEFLSFLREVLSNGKEQQFVDPIKEVDWVFVGKDDTKIKYYIGLKDFSIKGNLVFFSLLNDNREFRQELIERFNIKSKKFDLYPSFVKQNIILDCDKNVTEVLQKDTYSPTMSVIDSVKNSSENGITLKNSISDSICFSIKMLI